MTRVALYARVSTRPRPGEPGQTLETQLRPLRAFAEARLDGYRVH
jgi:hypothetical protein